MTKKLFFDDALVQSLHEKTLINAEKNGSTAKFLKISNRMVGGHWRNYISKLSSFECDIKGKTVLDFGCKFGHLTPLLIGLGAEKVYGVDVDNEHIEQAQKNFSNIFNAEFVKSVDCFINIPTGSVDCALVNEVISHINPALLDRFYLEMARVIRPGGEIVISDGNNLANLKTQNDLIDWYALWESGESKEFGASNYRKLRRNFISKNRINITSTDLDHISNITSGMWGNDLLNFVDNYLDNRGNVTQREYQAGIVPVHPVYGVVMERGFYPIAVEISLRLCGFDTVQTLRGKAITNNTQRGETKNFTILGKRIENDQVSVKKLAEKTINEFGIFGSDRPESIRDLICTPTQHEKALFYVETSLNFSDELNVIDLMKNIDFFICAVKSFILKDEYNKALKILKFIDNHNSEYLLVNDIFSFLKIHSKLLIRMGREAKVEDRIAFYRNAYFINENDVAVQNIYIKELKNLILTSDDQKVICQSCIELLPLIDNKKFCISRLRKLAVSESWAIEILDNLIENLDINIYAEYIYEIVLILKKDIKFNFVSNNWSYLIKVLELFNKSKIFRELYIDIVELTENFLLKLITTSINDNIKNNMVVIACLDIKISNVKINEFKVRYLYSIKKYMSIYFLISSMDFKVNPEFRDKYHSLIYNKIR